MTGNKTDIRVGMTIKDNDPRYNREAKIIAIETIAGGHQYAIWQSPKRRAKVRLDRIHTDGKKHTKGWSLVNVTGC